MSFNSKKYLFVTKTQWNGWVMLVSIVAFVTLAVPLLCFKKYGLKKQVVDEAIVKINKQAKKVIAKPAWYTRQPIYKKKEKLITPVELNVADTAALKTVYGIGSVFAKRIVKYRELLGGFYSKEQLREVYGIDNDGYARIQNQVRVNSSHIRRININTAEPDEFKKIPYLTFKQQNAILQYRIQHGNYSSAKDLEEIMILDEKTIRRIEPYLQFKDDRTKN